MTSAIWSFKWAPAMRRLAACAARRRGAQRRPGRSCQELGDGRLAAILVDCDRVGQSDRQRSANGSGVGCSRIDWERRPPASDQRRAAAVPLPPPALDVQRLIDAADRCQFAARSVQGDCLKSIEVW